METQNAFLQKKKSSFVEMVPLFFKQLGEQNCLRLCRKKQNLYIHILHLYYIIIVKTNFCLKLKQKKKKEPTPIFKKSVFDSKAADAKISFV